VGAASSRFRAPQLRQPPPVQAAYAAVVSGQVALIRALNNQIDELGEVVASHFGRHRDTGIYASQPGLGIILSARIMAEFGDDPRRFAHPRAHKNYAGMAPITRASGCRKVVLARYARNRRLADALHQWAFCASSAHAAVRVQHARRTGRSASSSATVVMVAARVPSRRSALMRIGRPTSEATLFPPFYAPSAAG
jgi:transposase